MIECSYCDHSNESFFWFCFKCGGDMLVVFIVVCEEKVFVVVFEEKILRFELLIIVVTVDVVVFVIFYSSLVADTIEVVVVFENFEFD